MTPRPTPLPSPAANPHGEIRQRLDAPAHAVTLTDLCALWQRQRKHAAATRLLEDAHSWFTEGHDTADLREARSLLEAIRQT